MSCVLALDVGGTKTLFGLFAADGGGAIRQDRVSTSGISDLVFAALGFLDDAGERPIAACAGVAGVVQGSRAALTNGSLRVDADDLAAGLGCPAVLVNDLVAMAHAIPVLTAADLDVLQAGEPEPDGDVAFIAVGTGLNAATVRRSAGEVAPVASESGVAGFAPRAPREIELLRFLSARAGHVSCETVVSGPGLANVSSFCHRSAPCAASARAPEEVVAAAATRRCAACAEAVSLFGEALGAEAGNVALRLLPRGGLYIGGGAALGIRSVLERDRFLEAFRAKAPLRELMETLPVAFVLRADTGLLGAAAKARLVAAGRG